MNDAGIQRESVATGNPFLHNLPLEESLEIRRGGADAMAVFIAWEKLRLLYNAFLAVLVIVELAPLGVLVLLPILLEAALVANICYCVGPVAEGYLCCIGVKRTNARYALFVLGTILSLGLTWAVLTGAAPWLGVPLIPHQ